MVFSSLTTQNVPKIWFSKFGKIHTLVVSMGVTKLKNITSYRHIRCTEIWSNIIEPKWDTVKQSGKEKERKTWSCVFWQICTPFILHGFSTNKPFAIRFNHFGDTMRRSYKIQQWSHSKFVIMNFHDQTYSVANYNLGFYFHWLVPFIVSKHIPAVSFVSHVCWQFIVKHSFSKCNAQKEARQIYMQNGRWNVIVCRHHALLSTLHVHGI